MNILFINYGDFTSNSLNHIGAFANRLIEEGNACVVAVPERAETFAVLPSPLFRPATFEQLKTGLPLFPDHRPADVVHVWTPRENVREAALRYLQRHRDAALVVHLEDNEEVLLESFARVPIDELRKLGDDEFASRVPPQLSHPTRFPLFLRLAHGITYITDRLREFCPEGTPAHRLLPGVDRALYGPQAPDSHLRDEIGVAPDEKLIVFTGSTTFANLADVRALLLAVRALNRRGVRCRLVRTGINPTAYERELTALGESFVVNLGFIDKRRLGPLLTLADVLVQPGAPDAFNDFRLPSKIPEFMCVGRPVVIPHANLAREMEHRKHALLLETGSPDEIADCCLEIFSNAQLAKQLSEGALEFAARHFDLDANTAGLLGFYESVLRAPRRCIFPAPDLPPAEDVLVALATDETLGRRLLQKENNPRLAELEAKLTSLQLHLRQTEAKYTAERSEVERLAQNLAQRDDKIRRMSHALSWRVTAPFRTLRRVIVDPLRGKDLLKMIAARLPSSDDPAFTVHLSDPESLVAENQNDLACVVAQSTTLQGWVLPPGGKTILAMRGRTYHAPFAVEFGLPRPDAAAAHPRSPAAATAGFLAELNLPGGFTTPIVLEALTNEGKWHCVAVRQLSVLPGKEGIPPQTYTEWVRRFDLLSLAQIRELRARIEALPPRQRPLISVLMPTYDTPEIWLRRAIESIRAQIYPHWELCIGDDASRQSHVREIIAEYAERDSRIKFMARSENGHISAASNSALELATGEFIALFDHDDELRPHALAEVALALAEHPAVEFIYSDEDKIDEHGRRSQPNFKPDWNPDFLLSQNYTCHLSVFRTARVRSIGGFRVGYEGSQDWDLTLRFTADLRPEQVHHIPHVLYHWRAIAGSTALALDEKDYPVKAARRTLEDHLYRTGITGARLQLVRGGHWHIAWPRPIPAPLVTIIIPTRNRVDLLSRCVRSILEKTTYPNLEFLIADNDSDDPKLLEYYEEMRGQTRFEVLACPGAFNFSAINNRAAKAAHGDVLALLNNDLEVIAPEWLDEMVAHATRPGIGCVGARLYYPNDTIQHAGVITGLGGVAGHAFKDFQSEHHGNLQFRPHLVHNVSAVTAACLVVQKSTYWTVGGFDETELPVAFNDVDFCLKVERLGLRNLYTPFAKLYHHESASRGMEDSPEKVARFAKEIDTMKARWGPRLLRDPAYNPNLTLDHEDFSLGFPPQR